MLKDLTARLPYNTKVFFSIIEEDEPVELSLSVIRCLESIPLGQIVIKPYLRSMESMTEEEKKEISILLNYEFYVDDDYALVAEDNRHRIRLDLMQIYIDYLNAHHFDYRGLIEKGLAMLDMETVK